MPTRRRPWCRPLWLTQAARDLMVSIARGDVSQMSLGFIVRPGGQTWEKDAEGRVLRILTALRLLDGLAGGLPRLSRHRPWRCEP